MQRKFQVPLHCFCLLTHLSIVLACGSWAGNGEKDQDESDRTLLAGDVMYHKISLAQNSSLAASYAPTGASLKLADGSSQNFEISVVDPKGREITYDRQGGESLSVEAKAAVSGDYVIAIKNNSSSPVTIENQTLDGAAEDKGVVKALNDTESVHSKISLKAVIVLARQCKQSANGGNSMTTRTAPDGEMFVQPFLFLGTIDLTTRRVERVSDAAISIASGATSMKLSRLDDFDLSVFRENGALSKAEHVDYTRSFYQGYFGAAGEFYTVDTFRFGGDCSKMPTFALQSDPGKTELSLQVKSESLAIDQTFALRPTVSTAFTLYESADKKLDNWDPCSYDAFSAEPKNFNTPSEPCRELDPRHPPFVTLDYLLPSAQFPDQYSPDSDPTRVLYYGHSLARSFKKAIIEQQADIRAGNVSKISLSQCMNNGGINSVAIAKEPSYLPLGEFNVSAGDLIQLSHKTGPYTALTQYFQGNADVSGTVSYPACIPNTATQESCAAYKVLQVETQKCQIKSDSGIFVTSFQDSFIYPEYYELTGSVKVP